MKSMKIFLIIFSVFCCLLDLKPNTSESFLFKSTGDSSTAISASFSFENLNLFYSNSFSFTKKIEKKNITQITDESILELEEIEGEQIKILSINLNIHLKLSIYYSEKSKSKYSLLHLFFLANTQSYLKRYMDKSHQLQKKSNATLYFD